MTLFLLLVNSSWSIRFLQHYQQQKQLMSDLNSDMSTRGGFRPAWAKDGGTFGTPKGPEANPTFGLLGGAHDPLSGLGSFGRQMGGSSQPWDTLDSSYSRQSVPKKKVVRYSRDQLLSMREPTKILPSMVAKLPDDVISEMPLEPELFSSLDEKELHQMWHDDRSKSKKDVSRTSRPARTQQPGDSPNRGPSRWDSLGATNDPSGWRRGLSMGSSDTGATAQSASWDKYRQQKSPPLAGLSQGPPLDKELDLGHAPSSNDESWVRGLKVSTADRKAGVKPDEAHKGQALQDEGWDDTFGSQTTFDLDLYSSATLEFEMEKKRMQALFGGGDADGLQGGGLGSGLDPRLSTPLEPDQDDEQPDWDFGVAEQMVTSLEDMALQGGALEATEDHGEDEQELEPDASSNTWYYQDFEGNVRGPFESERMRQWHSQGYFAQIPDLPVRRGDSGPFQPMNVVFGEGQYFPDVEISMQPNFGVPEVDDQLEELKRREAELEEQRRKAEREQQERLERIEQERQEEAARRKLEKEVEAAREEKERKDNEAKAEKLRLEREQQQSVWGAKQGSGQPSLLDIQAQEAEAAAAQKVASEQGNQQDTSELQEMGSQLRMMLGMGGGTAAAGGGGSGVWAKPKIVPATTASRAKSLLEIQEEERKLAAEKRTRNEPTGSGRWAVMAAGQPQRSSSTGSGGVWGSAPRGSPAKPPAFTPSDFPPPGSSSAQQQQQQQPQPQVAKTAPPPQQLPVPQQRTPQPAVPQPNEWGTPKKTVPMPSQQRKAAAQPQQPKIQTVDREAEFMSWCSDQLSKLIGSRDLTLIEFCRTLTDPAEVRLYLSEYLGSKPEVSTFATEFLRRKTELQRGQSGQPRTQFSPVKETKKSKSKKKGRKGN